MKEIAHDGIDGTTETEIAGRLGFREDQLTAENTTKVYARHDIDLTTIPNLHCTD